MDRRNPLQRLRVPLGFLVAAIFIYFAQPTAVSLATGAPLALIGLLVRGWASGHLRKNKELTVSGPYALTRNPLYFGSFCMTLGVALSGGNWLLGAGLIFLFLVVYYPVMQAEARLMRELFKDEYESWSREVPLFLPRPTPFRPSGRRFDFDLYLQHREYRAAAGVATLYAIFVIKSGLIPW